MLRFALALLLTAMPAHAGVELQGSLSWRSDDFFVTAAARHYDRDPGQVVDYGRRFGSADDLSVALHLSKVSGDSLAELALLRDRGMGWWDISMRIGADPSVWFVPVTRDPGPPYGKAWGHYKKHGKSSAGWKMSDDECRDWAAVRFLHDTVGMSVDAAFEARRSRSSVDVLADRGSKNAAASGDRKGNPADKGAHGKQGGQGKSGHGNAGKKGGS